MNIKQELYNLCVEFIDDRINTVQNTINDIQESLASETKSSAGDKHETGRAMLQLEREKAGNQLAEILKEKELLYKIDISIISKTVRLGSVIYTTQFNYFIAISAGELKLNNQLFYAISPQTPIGKLLIGSTIEDKMIFRNSNFKIVNLQ